MDCFTCEYAERDNHNRFVDRCSGFGNCVYLRFKGKVKPTLKEVIENLNKIKNNPNANYVKGFTDALSIIEKWNEDE